MNSGCSSSVPYTIGKVLTYCENDHVILERIDFDQTLGALIFAIELGILDA